MRIKELVEVQDCIWYNAENSEIFFEKYDTGDFELFDEIIELIEDNPFDTPYFKDLWGNVCYYEVKDNQCLKIEVEEVPNHEKLRRFEMLYLEGYFDQTNTTFKVGEEEWAVVWNTGDEFPTFFNLTEDFSGKSIGDYYCSTEIGDIQLEPTFDKEKDFMYYTLLIDMGNSELIDRYIKRLKAESE